MKSRALPLALLVVLVGCLCAALPATAASKAASTATRTMSSRSLLGQLLVVPKHFVGYSRGAYGRLVDADHDHCKTTAEVLIAEALKPPRIARGCVLKGGTWVSPYDGTRTTDPSQLGIDHLVPLGEAWQSGAWQWSAATRNAYLNDLGYAKSLVAVPKASLQAKGDRQPMTWLPTNNQCSYLASWVAVKWRWQLAVDGAEQAYLQTKLAACHWPAVATPHRATVAAVLCQDFEHLNVTGASHRHYQLLNIRYGSPRRVCMHNSRNGANFAVTAPVTADPRGKVAAFPEIYRGCLWTGCSYPTGSGMPLRVSRIGHPVSTWHTRQGASGDWNAAWELWFGKHPMRTGQADGAELMIWINRHGTCCHLIKHAPVVRIDGHRYYLMHWRPCSRKWHTCFNYIQFRLVHPTWRVDNLRLAPFIRKAQRLKLIRPWWFLENVGAGFEIWKGGKGLTTTRFDLRM